MVWNSFIKNRRNILELLFTVLVLTAILFSFSKFLLFIEKREGVTVADPVISTFSPVDLTWFTFTIIYLSIIIALYELVKDPQRLVFALQCYGLMIIFRAIAMYLIPLEAPATLLPLDDPFVQLFGDGSIFKKDLFFSGHTATLFLLFLLMRGRIYRAAFLTFTFLVGLFVILQHVHYSIDVFAAPFFAYTSFKVIFYFRLKSNNMELPGTDEFEKK